MNHFKKLGICPFVLVSGCAFSYVVLTEQGSRVRIVKSTPQGCEYVGEVRGVPGGGIVNDFDTDSLTDQLHNSLKNATAAKGGNTVEIIETGKLFAKGEAYKCK